MNSATTSTEQLQFRPLSATVGAEVMGLDLSSKIAPHLAAQLIEAFNNHHLLLVRGQDVTTQQQNEFGRVFGEIAIREKNRIKNMEEDTQHVSNSRKDGVFGLGELDFHMDQLFQEHPLSSIILYAIEVPDEGGETRFANAMQAYDKLSPELQQKTVALQCRHAYSYTGKLAEEWNMVHADDDSPSAVHPMMWTEPTSGRKVIWVNKLTTVEILGMPPESAAELMAEVRKPLYDANNSYTHHWKRGDLLIWNNKTLQHARNPFDNSKTRTLRRTPIL